MMTAMAADADPIPPDLYLSGFAPEIRDLAEQLRAVVLDAVPDAVERVRIGWRLIGYDVPDRRRMRYFAYVAPEPEHVHLGFERGTLMSDPHGLLEGAHLGLRQVRYVTYRPGDAIPVEKLVPYVREAADVAVARRAGAPR